MRKWLIFVLLLGSLILPSPAHAAKELKLKAISIELWAEYDQPSMLVIHEFTVDESVALPVQVKVRFPKDGNLTAVASLTNGSLVNTNYTGPEAQGNWQTVTLDVQSYAPHRIEYYEPLERDGNLRKFSFRWFGDYQANQFSVTVQLPSDSTNIETDPVLDSITQSNDGSHLVGIVSRANFKMGQSYEFKLEYERSSDTTSVQGNETSNVQPSEPIDSNTEGRVSMDNLPWVIGGLGLVLIVMALFFYWRSTQVPTRKPRQRKHTSGVDAPNEGDGQDMYCHECGTRAHPGDRFCRTCGSRLRV